MTQLYDLIIIGSGPAGLAAAVYAQRARLNTLILEKAMVSGGQVLTTYEVENRRLRSGTEVQRACRPPGSSV